MHIHNLMQGEKIADVAREYGTNEMLLRMNNGIYDGEGAVGEELLVLTPTRTYTAKRGDTPESLALRFGIRMNDLYSQNPWLFGEELCAGREIALRSGDKRHGMAAANGYLYKGCESEKLRRALPYLTYVTVAAAVADERGIGYLFNPKDELKIIMEADKVPLLRIYDRVSERDYKSKDTVTKFIDDIILAAKSGDYKGITLAGGNEGAEGYGEFLLEVKKRMLGCDLILITEASEKSPPELSDFGDGCVLSYAKYAMKDAPCFEEGEKKFFSDFACEAESAKTFIELPAFAKLGAGFRDTNEALIMARRGGCKIEKNPQTLISTFNHPRHGECAYTSLENVKAILDLIREYGFMGISFDIMRSPSAHLAMYNSLFKTATQTSVRAREGCSPNG